MEWAPLFALRSLRTLCKETFWPLFVFGNVAEREIQ
jgi:hypothetical protein